MCHGSHVHLRNGWRSIVAGFFLACVSAGSLSAQSPGSTTVATSPSPGSSPEVKEARVDRAGILRDFAVTLAAQQAYRLPREDVRQYLGGPFWTDYVDSISHLKKGFWDGDAPWTWNLVVHPVMGGLSYHQARTRGASHKESFLWTLAYSTHFELGVVGQAGLGNNRVSPVDLIVTPVAGALWASIEEWIEDRYLGDSRSQRFLRSLLPVHALTNLLRGDAPWRRHEDLSTGRRR